MQTHFNLCVRQPWLNGGGCLEDCVEKIVASPPFKGRVGFIG